MVDGLIDPHFFLLVIAIFFGFKEQAHKIHLFHLNVAVSIPKIEFLSDRPIYIMFNINIYANENRYINCIQLYFSVVFVVYDIFLSKRNVGCLRCPGHNNFLEWNKDSMLWFTVSR